MPRSDPPITQYGSYLSNQRGMPTRHDARLLRSAAGEVKAHTCNVYGATVPSGRGYRVERRRESSRSLCYGMCVAHIAGAQGPVWRTARAGAGWHGPHTVRVCLEGDDNGDRAGQQRQRHAGDHASSGRALGRSRALCGSCRRRRSGLLASALGSILLEARRQSRL